jgi:Zn-dependent peptidase ImmA (M78 family)
MTDIPVSGKVLAWARKFRGLNIEDAAKRLGWTTSELESYESDNAKPNFGKFEKLASVYQLPQSTLFLRNPPREPPLPSDFRTHEGAKPEFGFDFRIALSEVNTLQRNLSVLSADDEEFIRANLPRYDRNRDPWALGEIERQRLGVSVDQQLSWTQHEALRHWRAIIEQTGISVYLQKFAESDCRGFSLIDNDAHPALVLNKSDESDHAKIFTLAHEYAHLLIREPGISDLDSRNPLEAFCNRFAAGFLMSRDALRAALPYLPNGPIEWDDKIIARAARRLKVSRRALAIRLEEMGLASIGFNRRFHHVPKPKSQNQSGGNYVATLLSEIGGRYSSAVIAALDRGVMSNVDAAEALKLSPEHFAAVRKYVQRQRELASVG